MTKSTQIVKKISAILLAITIAGMTFSWQAFMNPVSADEQMDHMVPDETIVDPESAAYGGQTTEDGEEPPGKENENREESVGKENENGKEPAGDTHNAVENPTGDEHEKGTRLTPGNGTDPDPVKIDSNSAKDDVLNEAVLNTERVQDAALSGYFSIRITDESGTPVTLFGDQNEANFVLLDSPEEPAFNHFVKSVGLFGFSPRDGLASGVYLSPSLPEGDYWIKPASSPAGLLLPDKGLIPITITADNTAQNPVSVTVAYKKDPNSNSCKNGKSGEPSGSGIQMFASGGPRGGASAAPIGKLDDGTPVWFHQIYPTGNAAEGAENAYCYEHGKFNPSGTPYTAIGDAPEGKILSALVYLGGSDYVHIQGAYWIALGQYGAGLDAGADDLLRRAREMIANPPTKKLNNAEAPPEFNYQGGEWADGQTVSPNPGVFKIKGKEYAQYGRFTVTGASRGRWVSNANTNVPSGWLFGNADGKTLYSPEGTNQSGGSIPANFFIYIPTKANTNDVRFQIRGGYKGKTTITTTFGNGTAYDAAAQDLAVATGVPIENTDRELLYASRRISFGGYFNINFQKRDSAAGLTPRGAASFQGAVYGLYTDNGNTDYTDDALVTLADQNNPAVTDANGRFSLANIPWGKYYLREHAAPKGYSLNPEPISVDPDTMADETFTANITGDDNIITFLIRVKKIDKLTGGAPSGGGTLQGAEYTLYKRSDNSAVRTAVTDAAGIATFTDIIYDYYYVKETKPSKGYMINTTDRIDINPDSIAAGAPEPYEFNVTGEEEPQRLDIRLAKKDSATGNRAQGDATLREAAYGLYKVADGSLVMSGQTDWNGDISFLNVIYDHYYIQETAASEGYLLNPEKIFITDAEMTGNAGYEVLVARIGSEETVKKQAIEFRKLKASPADPDIIEPLPGVGFSVYLINELSKVKSGEIVKPAGGWIKEQFAGYFQGDYSGETRAKADGAVTPEYFSDANGLVSTAELPYGDYLVVETTMDRQHATIAPFIVNVTEDSRIPARPAGLYGGFIDGPFRLGIMKADAETGRNIFKNAAYRVWHVESRKWVVQRSAYPVATVYGTEANPYRIDPEKGSLILPEPLAGGTYTIVEVEAPAGYVLTGHEGADNTTGYYGNDRGEGKLYAPEASAYTPDPSTDITITMDSTDAVWDNELGAFIVYARVENKPQKGHLNIHKDKELPLDDYIVGRDDPSAKFADSPVKWDVRTNGWQTESMSGVTFRLFARDDIVTADGHGTILYPAGSEIPVYPESAGVYTTIASDSARAEAIVTDAEGNAAVKMLPTGKYTLKEISVSSDDMRQTESGLWYNAYKTDYEQDIEITGYTDENRHDRESVWNQENPFAYVNVNPLNRWILGRICLHKVGDKPQAPYTDSNGNIVFPYAEEPLDGVIFEVIAKSDIIDVNLGAVIYPAGTVVRTIVTDGVGNACAKDLIPGDYILHEKEPPYGYLPVPDEVFTIIERDDHQNMFSFMTWDLTDALQKLSIAIEKTDAATGTLIPGAVFGLYAAEDMDTIPADAQDNGNPGLLDAVLSFAGHVANLITGTAPSAAVPLSDPVIKKGTLLQQAASDENGKVYFKAIPAGIYTIREISAPAGYETNRDFSPTVALAPNGDGKTEWLTWTGTCANKRLHIHCEVDKDTIRRTAAAFESLPGQAGRYNIGDTEERYRYDVDFRSTASVWTDEFVVDDPLENADRKKIIVEELWTPVVWGDYDGFWNLWYATNKTKSDTVYSTVSAMDSNPFNPDNPGNAAVFPNTGLKLLGQGLRTDQRYYFGPEDFGLEKNEYLTHLRFEYGRVEVGFTSKNYADQSLNGEHRMISGADLALPSKAARELELLDPAEVFGGVAEPSQKPFIAHKPLDIVPGLGEENEKTLQMEKTESVVEFPDQSVYITGINGDVVDWTPIAGTRFFAPGALHPGYDLKPVSYLVSATRPMNNVDIVSSVSARTSRNVMLRAYDQDAVVTKEIRTFEYKDQAPGLDGPAKTADQYPLLMWLLVLLSASIGLLVLGRVHLGKNYEKSRNQKS